MATFKKEVDMTIYDDFESLVVEHCTSDDRVFLKASKSESDFIYFYVDVFKELHIQLLYADFECGMLRTMNIAYVQLHPNNWAFLRSFHIHCTSLKIIPTINKFMYFYQLKMVAKVGWASLNTYKFGIFFI